MQDLRGYHIGDQEEFCIMGNNDVQSADLLPARYLPHAGFLLGLKLDHYDGCDITPKCRRF
jgi:hypothetical protein